MVFSKEININSSVEELFAWHERPGAFERLNPPFDPVQVVHQEGGIQDGARVSIRVQRGPVKIRWRLGHDQYIRNRQFRDFQIRGPFKKWIHMHKFSANGKNKSILEDHIEYVLPFGVLGRYFAAPLVNKQLQKLFSFRHKRTEQDLMMHQRYKSEKSLRILISGSHGLVGSALIPFLTAAGHPVCRLQRNSALRNATMIYWDPVQQKIHADDLEGFDVIIHLGGVNIASFPWTRHRKKQMRDSRILSTKLLADTIAGLKRPPRLLITASATGFYGDRADEELGEDSKAGSGFLADVTKDWEAAAKNVADQGIRVAHLRFGLILSPQGGVLKKLILPFKSGLGAVLGAGRQYWPWITIDDVIGAIWHVIHTSSLSGPINVVSPNPVKNKEFTQILNKVLRRPTVFTIPSWLLRIVFGDMADQTLLNSSRVIPQKLIQSGYSFLYPDLETAVRFLTGKEQ